MPSQKVYAVIAGTIGEGEQFSTLELFDCKSTAQVYADDLEGLLGVDYVLIQEREIDFTSALAAA